MSSVCWARNLVGKAGTHTQTHILFVSLDLRLYTHLQNPGSLLQPFFSLAVIIPQILSPYSSQGPGPSVFIAPQALLVSPLWEPLCNSCVSTLYLVPVGGNLQRHFLGHLDNFCLKLQVQ